MDVSTICCSLRVTGQWPSESCKRMGKGKFVFLRGSLCGPESEAVHERGKSPQWGQTSGDCFPVLRAGGLENLKFGAGPLRGEPAFCERQQMAALSPAEQQQCSVMAKILFSQQFFFSQQILLFGSRCHCCVVQQMPPPGPLIPPRSNECSKGLKYVEQQVALAVTRCIVPQWCAPASDTPVASAAFSVSDPSLMFMWSHLWFLELCVSAEKWAPTNQKKFCTLKIKWNFKRAVKTECLTGSGWSTWKREQYWTCLKPPVLLKRLCRKPVRFTT